MASAATTRLEVLRTADGWLVRVIGRASLWESRTLKLFVERTLLPGRPARIAVDLSQCAFMDSTFLGHLFALHQRLGQTSGGALELAAPTAGCRHSLACTHLDSIVTVVEAVPAPIDPTAVELACEAGDERALAEHVLHCHRELVKIDGPNQAYFQSVADHLAAELAREKKDGGTKRSP